MDGGHKALVGLGAVAAGIVTVAIVATLVSPKAQTGGVIGAATSGLGSIIGAAVAPVTGGSSAGGTAAASSPLGALSSPALGSYGTGLTAPASGNFSLPTMNLGGASGMLNPSTPLYGVDYGGGGPSILSDLSGGGTDFSG